MHGFLVLSALLLAQGTITCLHIREFRVPAHVAEGSEAVLGCRFDLQGQKLYVVRWLKDDLEFYHFKPDSSSDGPPPAPRHFPVRGVSVDLARSGKSWVTLVYLSRESAGEYACEVVGQGPDYRTAVVRKNLTVDLLPEGGPEIVGVRKYNNIGQPLMLNCTSLGAIPISSVTWFINGEPADHYHLRGPWHTRSASKLGAVDTTTELGFGLRSSHFIHGVLTIKCRATLPPLYEKEVEIRYHQVQPQAREAILIEPTNQLNIQTTEPPCTSTIKIQVEESPNHFEPWSVTEPSKATSQQPNRAGLSRNFVDMVLHCVLLMAFLLICFF